MILLIGIPSEPPMERVTEAIEARRLPWRMWNQRHVGRYRIEYEVEGGEIRGVLTLGNEQLPLDEITGAYVRATDDAVFPEIRGLRWDAPERAHSRAQHEALMLWLDGTSARVANRPRANASNGSKPWQARAIEKAGFLTPPTLITNDPERVCDFERDQGPLIYKSASGHRSIVRRLEAGDRLERVGWCPVQFQRCVPGRDVRVHTVGEEVFATTIRTDAADYRYASREGREVELTPCELPTELAEKCRRLARDLELPFAGIDLRIEEDGTVWCFEANPCPGFSYYESQTGQPIADSLARWLGGAGNPQSQ